MTDVDIAEAQLSKQLAAEAAVNVAPMHAVLDFWRALRWLIPGWPVEKISKLSKLLKVTKDEPNPMLDGLVKLLDPGHNLVTVLSEGQLEGGDAATLAANALMAQARALAERETFFHWWTAFPTVFGKGVSSAGGGFDAVIGNPPWDRIKLQEVEWFAYKSVTAPSNMRTMIDAIVPKCGVGNSMAMLVPEPGHEASYATWAPLLMANISSMVFDFALRQKVQGQNLNWFIIEQSVVIAPKRFEASIDGVKIADFIRQHVLALTYTAHDMAPFARDMGYVHDSGPRKGEVKPPFVWDDEDRRTRLAALDALFFHLYGINDADAAYIMDTFPIVREHDTKAFGRYRTRDDVLAQLRQIEKGVLAIASAPPQL